MMNKTTSYLRPVLASVCIAVVMILAGAALLSVAPASVIAAPAQQMTPPRSATFYGPTAVTTGTTYSAAPLTVQSEDFARTTNFSTADVFVSTGANSSGALTVTLQVSPDEITWADSNQVIYPFDSSGVATATVVPYRVVLSGVSVGVVTVPLVGEFARVKIEAVGSLTPTVKITLR